MVNVSVQCVFNVVIVVIVVVVVDAVVVVHAVNCGQVVKIPYRRWTILLCAVHRCVGLLLLCIILEVIGDSCINSIVLLNRSDPAAASHSVGVRFFWI